MRTRRGSPARELASIAAEFSADALVIGAPRHFWHHLIGSVPELAGPPRPLPGHRGPVTLLVFLSAHAEPRIDTFWSRSPRSE